VRNFTPKSRLISVHLWCHKWQQCSERLCSVCRYVSLTGSASD
jgi:hypothetical protein